MVRTKSSISRRVSVGKSPKIAACKAACSGSSSSSTTANSNAASTSGKNKYSGGNPVHPRETPAWQKEITCFFPAKIDERSPSDEHDDESPAETVKTMQDQAGPSGT